MNGPRRSGGGGGGRGDGRGDGRGGRRFGGGPRRDPRDRRGLPRAYVKRPPPPVQEGEIEERLLEASVLFADGDLKAALAAAGEGVRLSPERPEGYVALGDINLAFGDLLEASRCFEAARAKASAAAKDVDAVVAGALRGLARTARLADDLPAAAEGYRALLEIAPDDPAASEAAEVFLAVGDFASAAARVPSIDDATPDEHLVAALIHLRSGAEEEAVVRARLAFFGNLYLLAALIDDEAPELGLAHGVEEARPDYARDVAERLRPVCDPESEAADRLALWASTPLVASETGAFIAAARVLGSEADPVARRAKIAEIDVLRNPARIRSTAAEVLRQAAALDAESCDDDESGDAASSPFQV